MKYATIIGFVLGVILGLVGRFTGGLGGGTVGTFVGLGCAVILWFVLGFFSIRWWVCMIIAALLAGLISGEFF